MGPRLSAAEDGGKGGIVNADVRVAILIARGTGTSPASFQLAPRKKKTRDPRSEEGEAINADK